MIPTVIVPVVAQLLLPLALVAWVAFGRHPYRARWWLLIALAWTWIAAIGVAGLWLALPWYLYLVHAGLLAAAILATWRREVPLPFLPQTVAARVGAALLVVLLAGAGALVTFALDGRRAPDAGAEVAFPLRAGTYLVVNGGQNALVSAHVATLGDEARFRPWRGQSHGVDIVKLGTAGLRTHGILPRDPAAYEIFGDPVHAPCTGTVIYRPETERQSHYFQASLSRQFDFVVHLDRTRALEPMERTAAWEAADVPETYPSGL